MIVYALLPLYIETKLFVAHCATELGEELMESHKTAALNFGGTVKTEKR